MMKRPAVLVLAWAALAALGATVPSSPAEAACSHPVGYRIGEIDSRFGLSRAAVSAAISDAAAIWESAAERDLFALDGQAVLTIAFIYDERHETQKLLDQRSADQKAALTRRENLIVGLEAEKRRYEASRQEFERRLRSHNENIAFWNQQGGAPAHEYRRIQIASRRLENERNKLLEMNRAMKVLVEQINALADRHNQAASRYNDGVRQLNQRYNDSISIGEFSGKGIRIFSFHDALNLRVILAHELGHALGLGHVDDPNAIMHFRTQPGGPRAQATNADLAEFARVCGKG